MNISITQKLFLAILTAAGLAVVSTVLIMQWSLSRGFLRFVNTAEKQSVVRLADRLEDDYGRELGWDFLRRDPDRWHRLIVAALPDEIASPPEEHHPPSSPEPHPSKIPPRIRRLPPPFARRIEQRLFLLDAGKKTVMAQAVVPAGNEVTPLYYQGQVVGYLGLLPRTNLSDERQRRFLHEQRSAFVLVAGVVVLLAAALSLLLARRLVRPLRELAKATDRLAAGQFSIRVPVAANDEIGRLGRDFNSLASVLARNEEARRQWVADISHELRTPLAVLRGEIEALQDGIREATPAAIRSLHGETLRLGRLVDDLYQLSLSDVGALSCRKDDLDLAELLRELLAAYRHEFAAKEIRLADYVPDGGVVISGDQERLQQLFGNLLENSLKYTTAGGELQVRLESRDGIVTIDCEDSAPGVPGTDLEKLFDRLYRVDSSRSRSTGGAGLGLAICRTIVDAHGGKIIAGHSPLGGLRIRVELPLKGEL